MAKPQVEDGHIKIASEIVEQLCRINLSAYEWRVLWAIWRKTYGWHKKIDRISYTQFEEITGLNRRHIARAINLLKAKNIISVSGSKHKLYYSFQKNYDEWTTLPIGVTSHSTLPIGVTKKTLPIGVIGITNRGNVYVTNRGKHNSIKHLYNSRGNFSSFQEKLFNILLKCPAIKNNDACKLPELLNDYPNVNYELEFKKFVEWWPGPKKRKKPWATLRNWLERASKIEKDISTEYTNSGHYDKLERTHE